MTLQDLHLVAIALIPLLFAITLHEVAHGWMAEKLGDKTARMLGRITLNPVKHIDLIGTIILPALCILTKTPFIFGWAKPVPVNQNNLRKPRQHMALVGFAGPASNFLMALLWAIPLNFLINQGLAGTNHYAHVFVQMATYGVTINLVLGLLNLLPIPPLDGGRILSNLLPYQLSKNMDRIEPYGMPILFALIFFGVLGKVLWPLLHAFQQLLIWV